MEVPDILKKVTVFDEMPEGWTYLEGAPTAPNGYRWIWNRKPRFGAHKGYEHAFLREAKQ